MASTDALPTTRPVVTKGGTSGIEGARPDQRRPISSARFREIASATLAMPMSQATAESLVLAAAVVAAGPRALARATSDGSSLDASAAIVLRSGLSLDDKISAVTRLVAGAAKPTIADKALAVAYVKGGASKSAYTLAHLKAQVDGSTRPLADELKDAFERLGLGPSVWANFAKLASSELRSVGALRERPRAATQGAARTPDQTNAKSRMPLNRKIRFEGLPGTGKTEVVRTLAGLGDDLAWDPPAPRPSAASHSLPYSTRKFAHDGWFRPLTSVDFGFDPGADLSRAAATDRNFEALLAHLHATTPRARTANPEAAPTFATNDSGVRAEGERYDLLAAQRRDDELAAAYRASAEALLPLEILKRIEGVTILSAREGDGPGGARARRAVFTAGPSGTGKTQAGIAESAEPNGFHLVQDTNPPRVPLAAMTQAEPGRFRRYVIDDVEGAGVSLGPAAGARAPFGDNPRLMGLDDARTVREISESIGTQLRELADGAIKLVK